MIFIILASLFTTLSMPGFLWGGFVWFSLVFLFKGLENKNLFFSALYSFVFYYLFTFFSLFWVIPVLTKNFPEFFGNFNSLAGFGVYLLLCLIEAVPFLIFGILYGYFLPKIQGKFSKALFVASIFTISDYLRGIGELGFTGGKLSDALFRDVGIIQLVSVFGTVGLTFLIVFINFLIYLNFKNFNKLLLSITLSISFIYLINSIVVSFLPLNKSDIPIVAVQTNYDQLIKYSKPSQEILNDISNIIQKTPNYLHIFPEATFPSEDIRFTKIENNLKEISLKKPIIIGFPISQEDKNFNSASVYANGKNLGHYDKIKLFPFVEFLPYNKIFEKFTFLKGILYFTPGNDEKIFEIPNYPKAGIQICFESYFPEISRKLSLNGAEFLITITNDGWYDFDIALWQHFSKSVFRAIENRKYMIQVSNKGITGLIDKYGRIIQILPPRTEKFAIFNVAPSNEKTLYTIFGDWFIIISLILAILIPLFFKNYNKKFSKLWF